jgi:hypothetical protein
LYNGVQGGYCIPNKTSPTWNKDMNAL